MKSLLSLLIYSCIVCNIYAQNLIINGSFEESSGCPTTIALADSLVYNWNEVDISSVEYFHVCGLPGVGVPSNQTGYQYAANGDAYIGMVSYRYIANDFREYFETQIKPLDVDSFYRVSMSVSLANSYLPTNGIGAFFYDSVSTNTSIYSMLSNTPQVSYIRYGTITDTQDWVRLVGYMSADSSYDNVVIGCFLNDNEIKVDTEYYTGQYVSYYFYDSIVIEKSPNIGIEFSDSLLCSGDTIKIPVFVNTSYFNSNTTRWRN